MTDLTPNVDRSDNLEATHLDNWNCNPRPSYGDTNPSNVQQTGHRKALESIQIFWRRQVRPSIPHESRRDHFGRLNYIFVFHWRSGA